LDIINWGAINMKQTKILIIGSSGLIGTALVPFLQAQGFQVGRLLRHQQDKHPDWNIAKEVFSLKEFTCPDIIINLCGEGIASGYWTKKKKQRLINSRLDSTTLLVKQFKQHSPALFINASAIGFYGDRGTLLMDENSPVGDDFVCHLSSQWELASQSITEAGTRLVNLRTGIVLSPKGGALAKMLPAFKLALGGKIGSGKQFMSWIDINDFCSAILFIINNQTVNGAVNMVAPNPVTNQIFTEKLARQLKRPCLFPIPGFMVKLLFGQMGRELLLASTNVTPKKLLDAGFQFKYEQLDKSLKQQLC